jgi:hypothetical protein
MSGQDLFGEVAEPAGKRKAKPKPEPTETSQAMQHFRGRHERRFGVPPVALSPARDMKHMKDLVGTLGLDEVQRLAEVFFTTADPQVTRRDYTVAAFFSLVPHLRIRDRKMPGDERTSHNLDAAERAMRPRR